MFSPYKDEEYGNSALALVSIVPNDDGTATIHMGMVNVKPKP